VRITALTSGGAEAETARVECHDQATVADVRGILARLFAWDLGTSTAAQFSIGKREKDGQLLDADTVPKALFLRGAALCRRARAAPPELVEVVFSGMPADDDDGEGEPFFFRLSAMTDCTTAELRAQLRDALGWSESECKHARLLLKRAGGFVSLKDNERLDARRAIIVHGAPLERRGGASDIVPVPPAAPALKSCPAAAPKRAAAVPEATPVVLAEQKAVDFNLERSLSLQRELLDSFGADSFQRRLKKLREECQGPAGARRYNVERLKLLLTVHGEVLPRYGFEGGLPGVMAMMAAFSAPVLAASAEVQRNGAILEKLIG